MPEAFVQVQVLRQAEVVRPPLIADPAAADMDKMSLGAQNPTKPRSDGTTYHGIPP
jgi:hypothetical protein